MTTTVHLWLLPGFDSRDLAALTSGRTDVAEPDRVAELVVCPPATPGSLEMTLLSGLPPRAHGIRFDGDGSPSHLAPPRAGFHRARSSTEVVSVASRPDLRVIFRRDDRWLRARTADDDASTSVLRGELRAELGRVASPAIQTRLLLVGGPLLSETPRHVLLDRDLGCAGAALAGAVAWLDPAASPLGPRELHDRLVSTPGIERVLRERAAELLQAPPRTEWMLVAEPGWTFTDRPRDHGHLDAAVGDRTPFVAAWGVSGPSPWSTAVHDWRVGETLLQALGATAGHDTALPL